MVKKNDNNKDSGAKDKAGKPAGRKSKALALAMEKHEPEPMPRAEVVQALAEILAQSEDARVQVKALGGAPTSKDSVAPFLDALMNAQAPIRNAFFHETRPQSLASVKTAADIGRLIRVARRRMDLNQQDFADLAGVGRRFVSELEGGKPTLEFDRVLQVCAAAGIDLSASQRAS